MADQGPARRSTIIRRSGDLKVGAHAGQRYRVTRQPQREQVQVEQPLLRHRVWNPAVVFVIGFLGLIVAGSVVLALPIATQSGEPTPYLDALFTATSAVCVTGLVVVDTGTHWSGFGQAAILLMIQVGGLGFMSSSTLLLMLAGRRASLRERVLLQESMGHANLGAARDVARRVVLFTLFAEMIGAALLTARFSQEMPLPGALWWGVFHAVSAFNNAGFDVVGGFRSLTPYQTDWFLLLTISVLLVSGGISYSVVEDVIKQRRWSRLALDSKLVVVTSIGLLVAGTLVLLWVERANPATLGQMDLPTRLLNAFFQSVAPRTAGFNSVDIGALTEAGLLVVMVLMMIGGSSASTAGGIKVQTFGVLVFATISAVRGLSEVEAFNRRLPTAQVLRAFAVATLALLMVVSVAFVLGVSETATFDRVLFEAVSAFGTVGLSTGITPDTSPAGRMTLIVTMFAGRLGPLTLALALAAIAHRRPYRFPDESIRIG